jgi:hypothetical protein
MSPKSWQLQLDSWASPKKQKYRSVPVHRIAKASADLTFLTTLMASPTEVPSGFSSSVQQHNWHSPSSSRPTKVFRDRRGRALLLLLDEAAEVEAKLLLAKSASCSVVASELMEIALLVKVVLGETVNAARGDWSDSCSNENKKSLHSV